MVFQLKNVWYVIRSNPDYSLVSAPRNATDVYTQPSAPELPTIFSKMTPVQGKVIDTLLNAEQKNDAKMQSADLDNIPTASRILIGDATADKLSAGGVSKSMKTQDFCNATLFSTDIYNLQQCLTEQYQGWTLNYSSSYSQNPVTSLFKPLVAPEENYYNVTQSVMETPLSAIDFSILKIKSQTNADVQEKLIVDTNDGVTRVSFGSSENYNQTVIFFREINNKTLVVSANLYSSVTAQNDPAITLAKKLILQAGLDKDLGAVKEQIKKNNSGFYPGMQTGFGV